jgi:hypothetical protein
MLHTLYVEFIHGSAPNSPAVFDDAGRLFIMLWGFGDPRLKLFFSRPISLLSLDLHIYRQVALNFYACLLSILTRLLSHLPSSYFLFFLLSGRRIDI